MRLPDFVVLGQGKAGTSLIYHALKAMPDIGLSTPKELHFFSAEYARGLDWYASHFADVAPDVAALGEVAPGYLRAEPVDRIAETLGRDTKVIFILRKPVEQSYARYIQNICATRDAPPFHVQARPMGRRLRDRVEAGIARAYDLFGPDNVLPLTFERDIAVPEPRFAQRIRAFLGLPERADPVLSDRVNPSVMPRYLYGGEEGFRMTAGPGTRYWIPARALVFCAQERNSEVRRDAPAEEVLDALSRQSRWSPEVSAEEYAVLQETHVIPAAERLMARFGLDLAHWRDDPPRRLAYPAAPPPPQFRARNQDE